MDKEARRALAERRLLSILDRHGIALARTLEQKISDAGPTNQRIDPHVLTSVRLSLEKRGRILSKKKLNVSWYFLPQTEAQLVERRLSEQFPVFQRLCRREVTRRVGQALEISVYKALLAQQNPDFLGSFINLDSHDDGTLYEKEEPSSSLSGRHLPGKKKLDFLVRHASAGWAGIEAKNIRQWFYPDRKEIHDLLLKCVALDCVPVLVARRIPFVTFKLLSQCGVVLHQTYNQLLPETEQELAAKARDKNLLGYHDIRTGNSPDSRLTKFIVVNLPSVLPQARERFNEYKDLLEPYAQQEMDYDQFSARVRRRSEGTNEDNDWPDEFEGSLDE